MASRVRVRVWARAGSGLGWHGRAPGFLPLGRLDCVARLGLRPFAGHLRGDLVRVRVRVRVRT